MQRGRNHRRRASAYVLILGGAMMVTVIGLTAVAVSRIHLRSRQGSSDWVQAGMLAFSGVEHALLTIDLEFEAVGSDWRQGFTSGVPEPNTLLAGGTFRWMLVDEVDGDLTNNGADPIRLYGIGQFGLATRVYSVLLAPSGAGLTCLQVALHAGGDLVFDNTTLNCNQIISANQRVEAAGSSVINADVEAVDSIGGAGYTGRTTTGITPRQMPDPASVFDHYLANGTTIDLLSLPASMDQTVRYLQRLVLSPASNPHGPTNPKGIYVIDCQGKSVIIEDCRIVGTLVLTNPGGATGIFRPVNWEPAVANYPALLVEGSFLFKTFDAQLDEASAGVNFNPAGTPYLGATDDLQDDTYPNMINGLVYVSNDASDTSAFTRTAVNGVLIVGNTLTMESSSHKDPAYLDLTYDQKYYDNPPPGFGGGGKMAPTAGTWQWTELP